MICRQGLAFLRSPAARRTLTTLVIAIGSSVVLTLGGCANPGRIEPRATLAGPGAADAGGAHEAPAAAQRTRRFA